MVGRFKREQGISLCYTAFVGEHMFADSGYDCDIVDSMS